MKTLNRIPEGVPAGGQFAAHRHQEPDVALVTGAGSADARELSWNERFQEVAEHVSRHGSLPTHNPARPESNRLASWLNDQRRSASPLREDRARRLDEVAPGWRDPREARWQQRLDEIRAYREANGRLPAAGKESNEVSAYGRWLVYQRRNEGSLPAHRIQALDELDRDWRDPNPLSWSNNVARAEELVARIGRFPTSGSADPDEHRVAEWLSSQRTHRGRMSREQVRELDSRLPGWNRGREQVWKDRLGWTAEFLSRNGRFPSQHSSSVLESSHAAWVRAQRRTAANLSDERAAMLDASLPGWRR